VLDEGTARRERPGRRPGGAADGTAGGFAGRFRVGGWSRAVAEVRPHRRVVLGVAAVAVPGTVWLTLAAGAPIGLLPATAYLAVVGSALAVIDARTHRLPNALVLPSYPVLALLLGAASLLTPDGGALVRALACGLALYGAYFVLGLVPSGLGFGDVKLAGLLGAYLGWHGWAEVAVGTFAAFVLGGVFAVILLATRRADRRTAIPFGPFMLAGALAGVAAGPGVVGEAMLLG
jgi:leader peptidase (prepilin peptidase) / N-methyltransferase